MTNYEKYVEKLMKNPEFKDAYDSLEAQYAVIREIVRARTAQGLTRKEAAERAGLTQGNLSRLENGNTSPTVETLAKVAHGLGKKLEIRFI